MKSLVTINDFGVGISRLGQLIILNNQTHSTNSQEQKNIFKILDYIHRVVYKISEIPYSNYSLKDKKLNKEFQRPPCLKICCILRMRSNCFRRLNSTFSACLWCPSNTNISIFPKQWWKKSNIADCSIVYKASVWILLDFKFCCFCDLALLLLFSAWKWIGTLSHIIIDYRASFSISII